MYAIRNGVGQPGGDVTGIPNETWLRLKSLLIPSVDPRYAWTALYSRAGTPGNVPTYAPVLKVFVIVGQAQAKPIFDMRDTEGTPAALQPKLANVRVMGGVVRRWAYVTPASDSP